MNTQITSGWFDLGARAGRSLYRLPLALREADDGITHCTSLVAAYGDPAVDPRSGGVVGLPAIAELLGRSERHTRRILGLPVAGFVRWVGDLPATNVSSIAELGKQLQAQARAAHCVNLKQFRVRF